MSTLYHFTFPQVCPTWWPTESFLGPAVGRRIMQHQKSSQESKSKMVILKWYNISILEKSSNLFSKKRKTFWYDGCSRSLWPDHEEVEIQGSFRCMRILQVNWRTSIKKSVFRSCFYPCTPSVSLPKSAQKLSLGIFSEKMYRHT